MTPDPTRLAVRGTGVTQHVPGARLVRAGQRFEEELTYARKADAHVWTVIVSHHLSQAAAVRLATEPGEEPALDAESVVTVVVGCFRCEQELDSRIVHRVCPGDAPQPDAHVWATP